MPKRTKIIATIGPASSSPTIIARLIRAGMDAARLNFSHGDWNDHTKRIRLIRQEAEKAGKQIAIIQDLQGPKLRVGVMQNDAVTLRRGDAVTVTTKKIIGTNYLISVTYPHLKKDLKVGATMLLDDGRLELKVIKKSPAGLVCKVVLRRRSQKPQGREPARHAHFAFIALNEGQGGPPFRHRAGRGLYRPLVRAHC